MRDQHASGQGDPETGRLGEAEVGLRKYELDWTILMAQAQDGDSAAYQRLLEQISPYLRSHASRYHRDPRDVEDTVQDILLTIHAVRHTFDPSRPFGPWLVGIANRRAFDRLRKQGRDRVHEVPLTGEHEGLLSEPDHGEEPMDEASLEAAIRSLAPAQQKAIRMLKLKQMSLKEASSETGMSIASLKMATSRALKNLRDLLSDREDGK